MTKFFTLYDASVTCDRVKVTVEELVEPAARVLLVVIVLVLEVLVVAKAVLMLKDNAKVNSNVAIKILLHLIIPPPGPK